MKNVLGKSFVEMIGNLCQVTYQFLVRVSNFYKNEVRLQPFATCVLFIRFYCTLNLVMMQWVLVEFEVLTAMVMKRLPFGT
jgi:hypothetical protein